jgi:ribosomal protein L16/L10AE
MIKDYDRRLRSAWKVWMRKFPKNPISLKNFEMGIDFGDPDYYEKWDR